MPNILKYLHSKKIKETVSEDYCPTDKHPSASLPRASFSACKWHNLLSESCYTVSCFLVSIQQLCPKQALIVHNALLCAMRKNFKGWYSQFHATSADEELIGRIGKVSSIGFGAEYDCVDVAQKIGTIILFRHVHSDVIPASEKMFATHNLPAEYLYSPCTAQRTQNVCPQHSTAHKRKITEYDYRVIHWLMSDMLSDLYFKLHVVSHVDYTFLELQSVNFLLFQATYYMNLCPFGKSHFGIQMCYSLRHGSHYCLRYHIYAHDNYISYSCNTLLWNIIVLQYKLKPLLKPYVP